LSEQAEVGQRWPRAEQERDRPDMAVECVEHEAVALLDHRPVLLGAADQRHAPDLAVVEGLHAGAALGLGHLRIARGDDPGLREGASGKRRIGITGGRLAATATSRGLPMASQTNGMRR